MSEVGGLFEVLKMMGGILVVWYSNLNLANYMLSKLHLQWTPEYL